MTAVHPLTATDLHIAELLTGGVSAQRILAIGQYRTAWGPQDVAYVHAYLTVRDAERQAEEDRIDREAQAEHGRKGGRPRLPIEHGTPRGYYQHRTRRKRACDECLAAHRVDRGGVA